MMATHIAEERAKTTSHAIHDDSTITIVALTILDGALSCWTECNQSARPFRERTIELTITVTKRAVPSSRNIGLACKFPVKNLVGSLGDNRPHIRKNSVVNVANIPSAK